MKDLLTRDGRKALRRFLARGPLFVFDYDGTLSELVGEADQAVMRPPVRRLLAKLVAHHSCSIVSGRARADVLKHLYRIRFDHVVGNHGMEWGTPDARARRDFAKVAKWMKVFRERLGDIPGLELEDKHYSISIHYRECRDHAAAIAAIRRAFAQIKGKRIIGGKQIFNVLPVDAANKGTAVRRIALDSGVRDVVFAGDDKTDEDVFRMKRAGIRVFSVHVGSGAGMKSAARYRLKSQLDIEKFLEILAEAPAPARERPKAR